MNELTEADKTLCVAYLDGLLGLEQKLAFEQRLAADPALARSVQALLETDELVRRLQAREGIDVARARRARPWVWAASLAAAAAVLGFLALQLLRPPGAPAFEVAVAPSYESAVEYIDSLPELAGLRPPGIDTLRGGTETSNVDAPGFVERARSAEVALAQRSRAAETSAGYFVLPLACERRSDVVVYAFARAGAVASGGVECSYAATLEAGRHVLPGERFELEGARALYRPGFLVPLGAEVLEVLVGVRPASGAPLATGRFDSLEEAARALAAQAFAVRRLTVREPAD